MTTGSPSPTCCGPWRPATPTPRSASPTSPPGPFEYAIDPTNAAVEVDLDDIPVVYLGEGAQLGYLPEAVRHQLGW